MPLLGDVFIDVVYSENVDEEVRTTDHAIEDGESIVDHTENKPLIMSITGIVSGEGAAQRLNQLRLYKEEGEQLKYIYRNSLSNVIIEKLSRVHDADIKGGFKFTITLKEIRIANPSVIANLSMPLKVHVADVGNKGRVQIQ